MKFHLPHVPNRYALTAVAAAILACPMGPACAQAVGRIEVTGSLIKRLSDQTALPVSTISAGEIEQRGHVELKEFLLEMPESMTIGTYAGTVGTLVNLRGLGQARSLTLMNGRRFANEPLTDQYVSANGIPKIAMTRVETLRDGASSSYGSDAIGGVQNYFTARTFSGVKLVGNLMKPQRSGGGDTQGAGIMAGMGDLASSGWNVYGAFEASKRNVLFRRDRAELSGLNPDGTPNTTLSPDLVAMGLAGSTDLTASQTTPANFLVARNATTLVPSGTVYNPFAATGCNSPVSVRTNATATTCSQNYRYLDTGVFGNGTELYNTYVKGTLALGASHQLSLEVNHSLNNIRQYTSNVMGITNANFYLSLPKTSKWYPGGTGGVPAVVSGTNTVANATVAASPATLYLRWLPSDIGLPELKDEHINDRVVLNLEGSFMGWDYRTGLNYGAAQRNTMRLGVFRTADLQAGLNNGTLNPFGAQDAAGLAYMNSIEINDQVRRKVKTTNRSLDVTLSREIFALSGGPAMLGLGGELRQNDWTATGIPENNLTTVAGALNGTNNSAVTNPLFNKVPTIWMEANPNSNQPDDTMSGYAKRDVSSLFAELEMPVTKQLTVNLAARADKYKYSHMSISSVNPKVGVRWAPNALFMARASANSGFRAPALPEIFGNADEQKTVSTFDDPVYCNSSTDTVTAAGAANGLASTDVCNIDLIAITKSRTAGTKLKPEKSTAYTFGFALQPIKQVSISVDYWNTHIKDVLGVLDELTMARYYSQFEQQFVRDGSGKLLRVLNSKANVGELRASGVDASIRGSFVVARVGTIMPSIDVSYINELASLPVGLTEWISAVATSEPGGITTQDGLTGNRAQINRWKHTAALGWKNGDFAATVSQRYQSKLRDRNEASRVNAAGSVGARDVAPYSQYNLTASYSGIKNLKLTVGVNNLTDVNPPLTNNSRYQGYLTQNADVLGRAYQFSAQYKF